MLNHIVLMGRLTRDPELRRTNSGTAVASFTLAVDRDYSSRDGGERQTDFIDIVAWRSTAEFVSRYFTKGQQVCVSGRLQIRDWQDKDGNKRRSAEVVVDNAYFADSKRSEGGSGNYGSTGSSYGSGGGNYGGGSYGGNSYGGSYAPPTGGGSDYSIIDEDDGDLPF